MRFTFLRHVLVPQDERDGWACEKCGVFLSANGYPSTIYGGKIKECDK